MPALLELQNSINKAYSRAVYGKQKRLSAEDKKKTELIVHLEEGSTLFGVDLTEVLNRVVDKAMGKLTGPQIVITILGLAAVVGTTYVKVADINSRAIEKEIDFRILQTEEETKRYEKIVEIAKQNTFVNEQLADTIKAQSTLIAKLDEDDEVYEKDTLLVNGRVSKKLLKEEKVPKLQTRLDGNYIILSVDSGEVQDGYRAK
ncbi:hypothetical protein A3843_02180 [Pseudovibrio exalbescens]|uniref:Uncharacterized protein n=2 Tax=Pseudovibrio exalbescens TaxID=197461 RepID=A0A1U7JKA2_9HYPH|nr:hypothetical protein A3843_02180 [Pseudovibrio exalbescens]